MELAQKLASIRNTLNRITVSGADNLNHLLGCIQTLDQIIEEMMNPDKKEEK